MTFVFWADHRSAALHAGKTLEPPRREGREEGKNSLGLIPGIKISLRTLRPRGKFFFLLCKIFIKDAEGDAQKYKEMRAIICSIWI